MCRIALTLNLSDPWLSWLATSQANGASIPPEVKCYGPYALILNRFDVTTAALDSGHFPMEGDRYVLAYNGEVFAFRDRQYRQSKHESDVHFAAEILQEHGLDVFCRETDLQGTYLIYDKYQQVAHILVDQLNTHGAFYAIWGEHLILASEHAVVHGLLQQMHVPFDVAIHIVKNGDLLTIYPNASYSISNMRPQAANAWAGKEFSLSCFEKTVADFGHALYAAVVARLPKTGPIAVLCSGGLDSSLLLTLTVRFLRENQQLGRLRVITLGQEQGMAEEENDFSHVLHLLLFLGLDRKKTLIAVERSALLEGEKQLFESLVFCRNPRLIPPNPVLNTQVRHTVMLANLLAWVVRREPEIKVVASGDTADEMFAGYPSMWQGVYHGDQLRLRILEKLEDLPLNDAARVALASCHGVCALGKINFMKALEGDQPDLPFNDLRESLHQMTAGELTRALEERHIDPTDFYDDLAAIRPVELRLPFSAHTVLETLAQAHPDFNAGKIGGRVLPKFLLRVVALRQGVPAPMALRRKIPFNQGSGGAANHQDSPLEVQVAKHWASDHQCQQLAQSDSSIMERLCLLGDGLEPVPQDSKWTRSALYMAAKNTGLARLLRGNLFREAMPDSMYVTQEPSQVYQPRQLLFLESENVERPGTFVVSHYEKPAQT